MNRDRTVDVIFRSDSSSCSHIPGLGTLRNGQAVTMNVDEAVKLCKTSGNFTLDLDSLKEKNTNGGDTK